MRIVNLMLLVASVLALAGCDKPPAKIDVNAAVTNAEFSAWTRGLPSQLKASEPNLRDRQRALFHACLKATTAGHGVTCRCNVRAYVTVFKDPALGDELDRAWIASARAFRNADKSEIAKVEARLGPARPRGEADKQLDGLQAVCGAPEAL